VRWEIGHNRDVGPQWPRHCGRRAGGSRPQSDRNVFRDALRACGVGCSVPWRPLHLHPYYEETYGWRPDQLPTATFEWTRLISLPVFSGLREEEAERVVATVRGLCARYAAAGPSRNVPPRKPR
jgi:dTDP-4-amino-4,6-dideoxygalactose transaminase